jgi:hypothetical protein
MQIEYRNDWSQSFQNIYYSLFSIQKWAIKLMLHKTLVRSVMIYAFPALEFAADTHLLKFECLQNKILRTTCKFLKCTPVHELKMTFQVPFIYV